jgi:S1-C subfamily serine protease
VDGTPVRGVDDVQRLLAGDLIGSEVRLRVVRDGRELDVRLVPAELEV